MVFVFFLQWQSLLLRARRGALKEALLPNPAVVLQGPCQGGVGDGLTGRLLVVTMSQCCGLARQAAAASFPLQHQGQKSALLASELS